MASRSTHFDYHPDPVKTGAFQTGTPVTCSCCGQQTGVWYTSPFFSVSDDLQNLDENYQSVRAELCPECIHNGSASKKYNALFQLPILCEEIGDKDKLKKLCSHTPSYLSWGYERWLAHCDDYCAYLGRVGWPDIVHLGIEKEIEEDIKEDTGEDRLQAGEFDIACLKENLSSDVYAPEKVAPLLGHLFQCLHCGRHRLWVDFA